MTTVGIYSFAADCRIWNNLDPKKITGAGFPAPVIFAANCLRLEQAEGHVGALLGVEAQAAVAPVGIGEPEESRVQEQLASGLPSGVDAVGLLGGVGNEHTAAAAVRIARVEAICGNVEVVGGAGGQVNRRSDRDDHAEFGQAQEAAASHFAVGGDGAVAALDFGAAVAIRDAAADVIAAGERSGRDRADLNVEEDPVNGGVGSRGDGAVGVGARDEQRVFVGQSGCVGVARIQVAAVEAASALAADRNDRSRNDLGGDRLASVASGVVLGCFRGIRGHRSQCKCCHHRHCKKRFLQGISSWEFYF